jgi:CDP-glucose 4,6-dehydratase
MNAFNDIYKNKNVLITGHTGFKGSWLSLWLSALGANVTGFSKSVPTKPSNFVSSNLNKSINNVEGDVLNFELLVKILELEQPDFIFHLAAQSLVKDSYVNPMNTWNTNTIGTLTLLEAVRQSGIRTKMILITSDKCYDNVEWIWGYRENDRLGGPDPYSASKGAAELVISSYHRSYFNSGDVSIASARAGNVIGGGDWASDRIVPDCMKAWSKDKVVDLRKPNATRPWQHVLEPLSGYLVLGEKLSSMPALNGESYNFGPNANNTQSVLELVEEVSKYWSSARYSDVSDGYEGPYESGLLKLNCDKALHDLSWNAVLEFSDTVRLTSKWYRSFYEDVDARMDVICIDQIKEYCEIARTFGMKWAN